jgi:DNA-binding CsgD family transcriptional regulator/streptogramin lyase
VRVLFLDREGVVWVGTAKGGVNLFNRETGVFTSFQHDPDNSKSLSHNEIRSIYEDHSGVIWIGTYGGGLNSYDRETCNFIRYKNRDDDPNSLSNDFVRTIYEDHFGVLWIGTQGGGINLYDRDTGNFSHLRADADNPESLNNDFIHSIYEDKSGMIWVGTWGGGLNRYDQQKRSFTHYTEKDGLPSNAVYGILEDSSGNLWLSTNNGISKFDPKSGTFKNYNVQDGLQSNEFNGGAYYQSPRTGEMFFGGIKGFNTFFPENIKDNTHIPPIVITSFKKFNQQMIPKNNIPYIRDLRLSYKDYVFSFGFAALDYNVPEKNRYAYKMEGFNKEWIQTDSKNRCASFTTLAPGKYVFKVKGSNNDGVWSEEGTSIRITIVPPFWKASWFRAMMVIFLIFIFLRWHKTRIKRMAVRLQTQAGLERFFEKYNISNREQEIIELILKGKSRKEIEKLLFLSHHTVKNHIYNIYQKLGVKNVGQLISVFINSKLMKNP